MGFLLLAFGSSALISIIMRMSSDKIHANRSMLAMNYCVCAFLGARYAKFDIWPAHENGFPLVLGLGFISGILFLVSFVLFQVNTKKNGVVLSAIFMKLGLLVPFVMSILLFGEMPTALQVIGFVIAIAAIIAINYQKDDSSSKFSFALIFLLLVGGSADVMAKVFEEYGNDVFSDLFLFYTFAVALVLCIGLVIWKKEKPGKTEFIYGAIIGVPNFFSSKFLIAALKDVPAVIAYPTYSVATILIVTLAGVFVFKEKLNKRQWCALVAILVALVLLNV